MAWQTSRATALPTAARWLSVCLLLQTTSPDVGMIAEAASPGSGECIPSSTDFHSFHCYSGTRALHCADVEERCPDWAASGECQANPGYMQFHCRKSCQTCLDGHVGVTQIAPEEASRSQVAERLVETATYLQSLNDDSENSHLLLDCSNAQANCTYWAVRGECQSNPTYMKEHCAAACQTCHEEEE